MFDPQQLNELLRRKLHDVPGQLGEGVTRAIRATPQHRLEQLMESPARRLILEGIFWQLPQHFDSSAADGVRSTVRWRITGRPDGEADVYAVRIADRRCDVTRGEPESDPQVTITVDGAEFLKLVLGASDPLRAYLGRRLAVEGDVMAAAKLLSLFKLPGSAE
ncbi:MAG: SCP2 sterol-binding domain-containing protein [Solirubrobacterales bacterium]|nr:SCP2 sterol-binding domain-containing protein [Solirubrobacterales bacterium]